MNIIKNYSTFFLFFFISISSFAANYYVNAKIGNDKNNGKSEAKAWKTLAKVSRENFKPGDRILLATGQEFFGTIEWVSQIGEKSKPIVISRYSYKQASENPIINAKGFLNGVLLENCSYIKVEALTIVANGGIKPKARKKPMRCGVLITTSKEGISENISLIHLVVKDIFFENPNFQRGAKEVKTANGTQSYGWGIRCINTNKKSSLKDISVENCTVSNIGHTGIKIGGKLNGLKLYKNRVFKTGGPGMQMSVITDGHVYNNTVDQSGSKDDSRKWGRGSGLWTWGCKNILIEHNSFRNASGPADSAGCHIDFNCSDVIVQYNISENNAGGFCEILGNNWNCAYRYNISINDGYRIKKKGVAFQEGKIFWLSGFVGKDRKRHGPYNSYFYNNTIYVKSDLQAKMAVSKVALGALLANNIFYIAGESKAVLGDQYKPQEAGEATIENVVFQNNLFLKETNWPKAVLIQDKAPVYGNPEFVNPGGKEIKDYIPTNKALVQNKGIEITKLPGDTKGLFTGMKIKEDIMGNPIIGNPDMGAIEISE